MKQAPTDSPDYTQPPAVGKIADQSCDTGHVLGKGEATWSYIMLGHTSCLDSLCGLILIVHVAHCHWLWYLSMTAPACWSREFHPLG